MRLCTHEQDLKKKTKTHGYTYTSSHEGTTHMHNDTHMYAKSNNLTLSPHTHTASSHT